MAHQQTANPKAFLAPIVRSSRQQHTAASTSACPPLPSTCRPPCPAARSPTSASAQQHQAASTLRPYAVAQALRLQAPLRQLGRQRQAACLVACTAASRQDASRQEPDDPTRQRRPGVAAEARRKRAAALPPCPCSSACPCPIFLGFVLDLCDLCSEIDLELQIFLDLE